MPCARTSAHGSNGSALTIRDAQSPSSVSRTVPSLERRFLAPFLVLITLTFAASLGINGYLQFRAKTAELGRKADSLLSTYAMLLADPLARQDTGEIYSYVTALLADSDVAHLRVTSSHNPDKPLFDVSSPEHPVAPGMMRSKAITHTVGDDVRVVAEIELGLTAYRAWAQLERQFWMMTTTLIVLLLSTFAFTRHGLSVVVRKPLDRMLAAIDVFDRTHMPQAIDPGGSEELDRLAGSLGELQGNVAALHDRMQQALIDKSERLGQSIDGHSRTESALMMTRQLSHVALNSLTEGVIATDWAGRISFVNRAAHSLLSVDPEQAIGRPVGQVIRYPSSQFDAFVEGALRSGPSNCEKFDLQCSDEAAGMSVSEVLASRFGGEEPLGTGLVLVFRDVTESRRLHSRLSYEATHDALTGLLNRRAFDRKVRDALTQVRTERQEAVVCFLDLDYFKTVNDTVGHTAGDRLLQQIAREIQACLEERDELGRLGGDEFALLLPGCDLRRAEAVCQRVIDRVSAYEFRWASHRFRLGCSAGIVAVTSDAASADELTDRADAACYQAKQRGRNRIHAHRDGESPTRGGVHWLTELSEILERDQIEIWGQKICATRGPSDIQWYEVLIRLRNSAGKVYSPEAFIRAAERYDKIGLLDLKVVGKTVDWMQSLSPSVRDQLRCSINLSGKTISNADYAGDILRIIEQAELPARSLCFEITESELIQNLDDARRFIQELRRLNCLIAMDDFGTGVCSFGYLRELNVDFVKIDGQFVLAMTSSPVDRQVVDAICSVSRAMGVSTIAEYVSDSETFAMLAQMNIEFGQGFGLHRPTPLADLRPELDTSCGWPKWRGTGLRDGVGRVA